MNFFFVYDRTVDCDGAIGSAIWKSQSVSAPSVNFSQIIKNEQRHLGVNLFYTQNETIINDVTQTGSFEKNKRTKESTAPPTISVKIKIWNCTDGATETEFQCWYQSQYNA